MRILIVTLTLLSISCAAPRVSSSDGGDCGPTPLLHRDSTVCTDARPPGSTCPDGPDACHCTTDGECDGGTNGRCVAGRAGYSCSYDECSQDSDCNGAICGCRLTTWNSAHANVCVSGGDCALDSDCGPCGFCSPSNEGCGVSYFCHTPKDECFNDTDCPTQHDLQPFCALDPTAGYWKCTFATCSG